MRVFIIEDEPDYAALLRYQLRRMGELTAHHFTTGEEALGHLALEPDLVLLDLVMPGQGGLETLRELRARRPKLPVVIVSAQTNIDVALEAVSLGAYDYITKGHDDTVKVRALAERVAERLALTREVAALRSQLPAREGLDQLVGESKAMARVFHLARKVVRSDLAVAILGESGTGKELLASAIHHNSSRRDGPFVVVNCAAIPRDLMESEFFGHEKGAFTGAHARKAGKFEQADGGTLFLDEVGEMNIDLQAKLLRALQSHEVQRVGGSTTVAFDARILCATNRDILTMVRAGTFREDLYYRLFQFPVELPPLRERDQDVMLLARQFRQECLARHPELEPRPFSPAARRFMLRYAWPGNVRQLKNAIERALLVSETPEIQPDDLMIEAPGDAPAEARPSPFLSQILEADVPDDVVPLDVVKQLAVMKAYHVCHGNIERTAARLGVARSTVYRILEKAREAEPT